jgi:alpha-tubulin suppressor-like RCC1 family protein
MTETDHVSDLEFNSSSFAVSTPVELTTLRGKNIVDIVAGGWSFHALDKHGRVWMWGTVSILRVELMNNRSNRL